MPPVGAKVSALSEHQGAAHLRLPPSVVLALRHPGAPPAVGLGQRLFGIDRLRWRQMGGLVREDEGYALALGDCELRQGGQLMSMRVDRCAEPHRVRAGNGREATVAAAHPRHHVAIVESQTQRHRHRHIASDTLDNADYIGGHTTRWHEVDEPDASVRGVPLRFEHQRLLAVVSPRGRSARRGCHQPRPGAGPAEQRREAGR